MVLDCETVINVCILFPFLSHFSVHGADFDPRLLQSLSYGGPQRTSNTGHGRSMGPAAPPLPEIKGSTYGQSCNHDLHLEYIDPVYKTKTWTEFEESLHKLRQQMDEKPEMETQTCFAYQPSKQVQSFNKCYPNNICGCNDEEPLVSELDEATGQCRIKQSETGDNCDVARAKQFKDLVFDPFRKQLAEATEGYEYGNALDEYLVRISRYCNTYNCSYQDDRMICSMQMPSVNLECKPNGKCGCLDESPYFEFTVSQTNASECVAKQDSVCSLVAAAATEKGVMAVPIRTAQCARIGATRLRCVSRAKLDKNQEFKTCAACNIYPKELYFVIIFRLLMLIVLLLRIKSLK